MKKGILVFIGIIFFALLRFSIFPSLQLDFFVNLSLLFTLFSTFVFGKTTGLFFAFVVGLLDDLFSWIFPPGTHVFLSLLLVVWVHYLLDFLFTNRSRYTLLFLSIIGMISYIVWKALLSQFFSLIGWEIPLVWYSTTVWKIYLFQSIITSLCVFFLFRLGESTRFITKTTFLK